MKGSISDFSKALYLNFFKDIFSLMRNHSKPSTRLAFLNADFRDFQGIQASDEESENAILVLDYAKLLETCGWKVTHLIDCPLSTERFSDNTVSKMQDKRILGTIRRTMILGKPDIHYKKGWYIIRGKTAMWGSNPIETNFPLNSVLRSWFGIFQRFNTTHNPRRLKIRFFWLMMKKVQLNFTIAVTVTLQLCSQFFWSHPYSLFLYLRMEKLWAPHIVSE